MAKNPQVTVLIPTYRREHALVVTLTSLFFQTFKNFKVVISDQSSSASASRHPAVASAIRLLQYAGNPVKIFHHVPKRGMAEQRQFLLDKSDTKYTLFLDDDVALEPYVLKNLTQALKQDPCGFVGQGLIGLKHLGDVRPDEQDIEFWEGKILPETVRPGTPAWQRYKLHNAANLLHIASYFGITPLKPRRYKVAWVGGCVMYDTDKLRQAGGFSFWKQLPPVHCGEDVLAELNVMEKFGGCGLLPSGAYHLELPTTLPDRRINAPEYFFSTNTRAGQK